MLAWLRRTWFRHLLTLRPMSRRVRPDDKRGTVYRQLGPFYWDGEPGGHVNHFGVLAFGRRTGIRDSN